MTTRRAGCIALGILLTFAMPSAAKASSLQRQFVACKAISEDTARLACFDAIDVDERGQPLPSDPHAQFGAETRDRHSRPPEDDVRSISATVERIERRPFGEHVFHLSNGQTWTELEAGARRYRDGMEVTIERTALGGYVLSTAGGRATRVRRVE